MLEPLAKEARFGAGRDPDSLRHDAPDRMPSLRQNAIVSSRSFVPRRAAVMTTPRGVLLGINSSVDRTGEISTPAARVGMMTTSAAPARLPEPCVARRSVDDREAVAAAHRLGQRSFRRRLDNLHALDGAFLQPLGRGSLPVGVDQEHGPVSTLGCCRGQVDGGRRLPHPALHVGDHDVHGAHRTRDCPLAV